MVKNHQKVVFHFGFKWDTTPEPPLLVPSVVPVVKGLSQEKMDLSFPIAPQCPGKGGWPCRKLRLVDKFWGGSKDSMGCTATHVYGKHMRVYTHI